MTLELPYDTLLPLRDAKGVRIACLDGALWVTQEGDRTDTILEAGSSFEVSLPGNTVVVAVRDSRVSLLGPASGRFVVLYRIPQRNGSRSSMRSVASAVM